MRKNNLEKRIENGFRVDSNRINSNNENSIIKNPLKNNSINKIILLIALILFSLFLSTTTYAARDFIIENRTSSLFVVNGTTGNVIIAPSFGMVGIGTASPINTLTVIGSVTAFGSLNATFINATAILQSNNQVQTVNAIFNLGNYSTEYGSTGFRLTNFTAAYENKAYYKLVNFTSNYDLRADRFGLANYSAEYASTGYKLVNFTSNYDARTDRFTLANYSAEYASTGYKLSNFTSNLNAQNASLWNRSSTNTYLRFIGDNVGIGTMSPLNPLHVVSAATFAGGVNASSLNVTGFSITDDSLVTLSDGSKKKIKDIKAGEVLYGASTRCGLIHTNSIREDNRQKDALLIGLRQNLFAYLRLKVLWELLEKLGI